jgi:hypothetical protein
MLNLNAPMQLRNGAKVRLLGTLTGTTNGKNLVFAKTDEYGCETVITRKPDGRTSIHASQSSLDVINTPSTQSQFDTLTLEVRELIQSMARSTNPTAGALALQHALSIPYSEAYDFVHTTLR